MSTSRRTFLITTGVAAAGTAAAAGAGPADAAPAAAAPAPGQPGATSGEPLVAYVSDLASGQVTVMRGDDEVTVTDHDLARRIAGAVG